MAEVTTKLAGQSFGNRLFYGTIRFIVIVICRLYLRLRIIDAHKIPRTGTYTLASSEHTTDDIPLAAQAAGQAVLGRQRR